MYIHTQIPAQPHRSICNMRKSSVTNSDSKMSFNVHVLTLIETYPWGDGMVSSLKMCNCIDGFEQYKVHWFKHILFHQIHMKKGLDRIKVLSQSSVPEYTEISSYYERSRGRATCTVQQIVI